MRSLLLGAQCHVYVSHSIMPETMNDMYSQCTIMAIIREPPFKFQSAAHNTEHLILAPDG
jgi:hypothetical protein